MQLFKKILASAACLVLTGNVFAFATTCPTVDEVYNKTVFNKAMKTIIPQVWQVYSSPFKSADNNEWTVMFIKKLQTYNAEDAVAEAQKEFKDAMLSEPKRIRPSTCSYSSRENDYTVLAFVNLPF